MDLIGNWLEGSGWTQVQVKDFNSWECRKLLDIKRTKYAHELTVAALSRMSYKAYEKREEDELEFSYPKW